MDQDISIITYAVIMYSLIIVIVLFSWFISKTGPFQTYNSISILSCAPIMDELICFDKIIIGTGLILLAYLLRIL